MTIVYPLPTANRADAVPVFWMPATEWRNPKPSRQQTADPTRPGTARPVRERPVSATAPSAQRVAVLTAYVGFLEDILDICEEDQAQGTPASEATTGRALYEAEAFLRTAREVGVLMPGNAYPDGEGGLQLEWKQNERQVRVLFDRADGREDYLYWQDGNDRHAVEAPLTHERLWRWLHWLQGNLK